MSNKPTTQKEYRRALDLFIIPAIGSFKIVDVERRDISELHHSMRNKPYQANRVLGVLSKMFNLAEISASPIARSATSTAI